MKNRKETGMTSIVKTIAKFTCPLIILFGIYMVLHGHLSPGGGFPGGVIIASAFILLTISFGKETAFQKLKNSTAAVLESLGALIFLVIALLGMIVGGWFFVNVLPKGIPLTITSAGFIPFSNIAIALKVSSGIFGVFIVMVMFRLKEK